MLVNFFRPEDNVCVLNNQKGAEMNNIRDKRMGLIFTFIAALTFVFSEQSCRKAEQGDPGALWPQVTAYRTGYLQVSAMHQIFYQLGGNPDGKPVMVLHGGPGAGCYPGYFRYFNPERYNIILHDQRGSGQSKPYAETRENTTQNLVEDIEKLRKHLNLGKVLLFGGSWGTTLALAYAEAYPQNVSGMILRGVFTASKSEIDHFYHGGTASYFPENYDRLLGQIDEPDKLNYPSQLLKKIQSPDTVASRNAAAAWARYEGKISAISISDEQMDEILKRWPFFAFSMLENYYMANNCFLEDGEILSNAGRISEIPAVIINGRYDIICPPVTAYKLHKLLPQSKLWIIEGAGHSSGEPGIEAALVRAARDFE